MADIILEDSDMTPEKQRRIQVLQKGLKDVKNAHGLLAYMKPLIEANDQQSEIIKVTETEICKFVDSVLDVAEELAGAGDEERAERLQDAAKDMLDRIRAELIPPGRGGLQ